jgi:hypothetical protein
MTDRAKDTPETRAVQPTLAASAKKLPNLTTTYWSLAGHGDVTGDLLTPAGLVKAVRTSAGQWPRDLFDLAELQAR